MSLDGSVPAKAPQRGIATLALVIVLLVAGSLIVFFANRSLVFEQRASANQLRSARALAAAESGLEWAIARLNDPRRIDAQCTAATAEPQSFRERYAPAAAGSGFAAVANARPGCQLGEASLACACPQPGQAPQLDGEAPSFTVELAAVAHDVEALLITARGCTSAGSECVPGSSESADATAVVQSVVKLLPPWTAMPVAAVTSGDSVEADAGVRLVNTDTATQGLLIDAGGAASGAGLNAADGLLTTVPGSPPENAVLRGDDALAVPAAQGGEVFFMRRFGQSLAQFRASPAVRVLAGCTPADCAAQIAAAGADGFSAFYIEGDLQLGPIASAQAPGSEARPLLIVVAGNVGAIVAAPWFGLIHATGTAVAEGIDLRGAFVARGSLRLSSGTRIAYEPHILQKLRAQLGSFAKVPGSWRDGRCASDDAALPCGFEP